MEVRDLGEDKELPLKYLVNIMNCWSCFTEFIELYPSELTPGSKDKVYLNVWWGVEVGIRKRD